MAISSAFRLVARCRHLRAGERGHICTLAGGRAALATRYRSPYHRSNRDGAAKTSLNVRLQDRIARLEFCSGVKSSRAKDRQNCPALPKIPRLYLDLIDMKIWIDDISRLRPFGQTAWVRGRTAMMEFIAAPVRQRENGIAITHACKLG